MTSQKVFIAYSWDNEPHKAWVLNLANQLLANGVNVILDQYELKISGNLTYFMEKSVREADKVILILTENYKLKAEERSGGAGFEYSLINSEWYNNQVTNNKFIPVLRGKNRALSVPSFVRAFISLDMSDDAQWDKNLERLLRVIYEKPELVKPQIGPVPDFLTAPSKINHPKPAALSSTEQAIKIKRLEQQKEKIKKYVGRNRIEEALQLTEKLIEQTENKQLQQEIIMYKSSFERYKYNERYSLKPETELTTARARVIHGLLGLLDSINI